METRRSQQNRGGGDGGSGAPSSPPGGGGMGGPTRCCLRRKERHGGGALGSVLRQALLGGFDSTGGVRRGWGGNVSHPKTLLWSPAGTRPASPIARTAAEPSDPHVEQLGGGRE